MNARTLDPVTIVYLAANDGAASMFEIPAGEEIAIAAISKNGKWLNIIASDGRRGFISKSSRLFILREVALRQNHVNVMERPDENAAVKLSILKGDTFTMHNVVENAGQKWVEVKYVGDETGFIPGSTKIKGLINKEAAYKNMGIGGLICLVGIIITVTSYNSVSQTGGSYIVAWGAIVFGAIRFFRGVMQLY